MKAKPDPMPSLINPMLAHLVDKPFNKKGWLFEIKWDGYRAIAMIRKGKAQLLSRNHKSFNRQFPQIVTALNEHLKQDLILDGEITVLDDHGRSQFQLMQGYQHASKGHPRAFWFTIDRCLRGHRLTICGKSGNGI